MFFNNLLCNITRYDFAKFHVKRIFLSRFSPGGTMCSSLWAWSDKNTLADRVKDTAIKRITVLPNSLRKDDWKQTKLKNYLCEKFSSAKKKSKLEEWRIKNLLVTLCFDRNLFENLFKIFLNKSFLDYAFNSAL